MSWVKIDDGFADHPKVAKVGAVGAWIQVQALCYCNRNLTDGFVPWGVARSFITRGQEYVDEEGRRWSFALTCGMQGRDLAEVDWPGVLVEAGIWEAAPGGYRIHDYKDYQPTRTSVMTERDRHSARQKAYMERKRSQGLKATDTINDAVSDGVNDGGPVPVPVPTEDPPAKERKALSLASPPIDKPAPRRATQWPDDFTLTLARADVARQLGVDAAGEWNKFRDHALKDGKPHKDWDAAWRYWCRQAPNFERRRMS